MITQTVFPICYICVGFAAPIWYELSYNGTNTVLSFSIHNVDAYLPRPCYDIGKTYTITLDSTFEDVNGNRLKPPYSFLFEPEPYFRVTSSSPLLGDSLSDLEYFDGYYGPFYSDLLTVVFNSKICSTIYPFIHISPPINGSWSTSLDSLAVGFIPTLIFKPGTAYSITVNQGATDLMGHTMPTPYSFSAQSLPFRLSQEPVDPQQPFNYLYDGIDLYFTCPVDTNSIAASISISPSIPITTVNSSRPIFYATNDFTPSTMFQVTISTNLKAADESPLPEPVRFAFATGPFAVSFSSPSGAINYAPAYVDVEFTGRIDTASVASAFSISPPIDGYLSFYSFYSFGGGGGREAFQFAPSTSFQSNTQYTVTISTALHSIGGYHLSEPVSFNFTIAP
jgi:hypothetical protein